jgi:hypothetical protein
LFSSGNSVKAQAAEAPLEKSKAGRAQFPIRPILVAPVNCIGLSSLAEINDFSKVRGEPFPILYLRRATASSVCFGRQHPTKAW